jgi:hypothetical protein
MTFEEADNELCMQNSVGVMPKLLNLAQNGQVGRKTFLRLLGEHWTRCDNIGLCNEDGEVTEWISWAAQGDCSIRPTSHFQPGTEHIPLLMSEEERRALASLPEVLTIYRGCGPQDKYGLSWSLNPHVARTFPYKRSCFQQQKLLMTARILRKHVCALKLSNEEEIVVLDVRCYAIGIGKQKLPIDLPPEWIGESTLTTEFPHRKIFLGQDFTINCGVISLHRRSNPPAGESGVKAFRNSVTRDGMAAKKLFQWMQ